MSSADKETDPLSFEKALQNLENIVDSMESGETPLAEMVAQFEKGNALLKLCQSRLQEAEMKIETLKKENETFKLESFNPESEN